MMKTTLPSTISTGSTKTQSGATAKLGPVLLILVVGVMMLLAHEQVILLTKNQNATFSSSSISLSATSSVSTASSSTREMIGEWIGNVWIPPYPWKYFNPMELKDLYHDKAVIWMGDSLARRSYVTFYGILNATTTSTDDDDKNNTKHNVPVKNIDDAALLIFNKRKKSESCAKWSKLNAGYRPDACRPMPGTNNVGELLKIDAVCFKNVEWFFHQEYHGNTNVTADIDVIVLILGIWEVIFPDVCKNKSGNKTMLERLDDAIEVAANFTIKTGKRVVWRTSGFSAKGGRHDDTVRAINQRLMDNIDKLDNNMLMTYVNWGEAIEPRSSGSERLVGDMHAHYAHEPRVILIQMLTNHLQDVGFFQQPGIRTKK